MGAGEIALKVIAGVAFKGGVGKTTVLSNLSISFIEIGLKVGIIDLDPQSSVSSWGEVRESEEPMISDAKAKTLGKFIEAGRNLGLDLMLIDTPPSASIEAHEAIIAADYVLIPCRPGYYDLKAVTTTTNSSRIAGKPYGVVFNAVPPRGERGDQAIIAVRDELRAAGVTVLDVLIHQRSIFSSSATTGSTAVEQEPAGKAAAEIRSLRDEIVKQANIQTSTRSSKRKVA
ncbi:ParA family protein [Methylobacterium nodulans]|uniref:ParA family protein n=1 Tax=Methylobacterium nodulans TaxID=114616 RepID=UPI0018DC9537|nr:ParA family protein [Methylobacterium nodulans]